LYKHKNKSKKEPERKVYKHIINLGWENVKIILIEEFQCKNKDELRRREQEEIDKYKTDEKCLNYSNAFGVDAERIKKCQKRYHEAHREERLSQMKAYHESNREEHLSQMKIYYKANRDEINKKRREKYAEKKMIALSIKQDAEPRQPEEISSGFTEGAP
jgi:hypothetical protein